MKKRLNETCFSDYEEYLEKYHAYNDSKDKYGIWMKDYDISIDHIGKAEMQAGRIRLVEAVGVKNAIQLMWDKLKKLLSSGKAKLDATQKNERLVCIKLQTSLEILDMCGFASCLDGSTNIDWNAVANKMKEHTQLVSLNPSTYGQSGKLTATSIDQYIATWNKEKSNYPKKLLKALNEALITPTFGSSIESRDDDCIISNQLFRFERDNSNNPEQRKVNLWEPQSEIDEGANTVNGDPKRQRTK